jgi:FkbM family methyltransferase
LKKVVKTLFNVITYKLPYFAISSLIKFLCRERWSKFWNQPPFRKIATPTILPDGNVVFCWLDDHGLEWDVYHNISYDTFYKPKLGDIVIDAGAHVGFYTVKTAKQVGLKGLVIAVEPEERNYSFLKLNVKVNKFNNVIPIRVALSDYEGRGLLFLSEKSCAHSLIRAAKVGFTTKSTEVSVKTIDGIIEKLRLTRVDLLKVDVEGIEFKVLKGAKKSLKNGKIFRIIMELHMPFVQKPEKIISLLRKFGYMVTVSNALQYLYAYKS